MKCNTINLHIDLKSKFEENKKISKKNSPIKKLLKIVIPIFLLSSIFFYFSISGESNELDLYQSKIDDIETKIDNALLEQNYDYALILIDQLVWDYKLNYNENKLKSESYEKKRESLKETIYKLRDK